MTLICKWLKLRVVLLQDRGLIYYGVRDFFVILVYLQILEDYAYFFHRVIVFIFKNITLNNKFTIDNLISTVLKKIK